MPLHHQPARACKNADVTGACIAAVRLGNRMAHEFPTMEMTESEALDLNAKDPDAVHLDLNRHDLEEVWIDLYQAMRSSLESFAG